MLRLGACWLLFVISASHASQCANPTLAEWHGFSTLDSFYYQKTTIVVDFTLKCDNSGAKAVPLYWELNGKFGAASQIPDSLQYQVAFMDDHKSLPKATYVIKIYDQPTYTAIQKTLAAGGEPASSDGPIFTINHYHKGASGDLWISSSTAALTVSAISLFYAYQWRTKL